MTHDLDSTATAGQRGPAESSIRDQIVAAASEHFRHYGYAKTTVSDLAKAIGFSKAYIYKFFESKQAIGEAICHECLDKISLQAHAEASECKTANEKLRRFFKTVVEQTVALLFNDKRVYDMAAVSTLERWSSYHAHMTALSDTLTGILAFGRETGEFERKTALDETSRAILQAMQPFINPLMLEYNIDIVPDGSDEVVRLVLRSLAP
jgi:AcrR family transcriptional regulator